MIKPIQTAGIAMLLGVLGLPLAQAQTPAQNAAREVVRRQAAIIELRNKLAEANTVEQSGSLTAAAILYEEAQKGVESIGLNANGIDAERAATLEGLTRVRLALGEKYATSGNLNEARKQVQRVLVLSPGNLTARAQLQSIDVQLEKLRGRMPTEESLEEVKDVVEEKIQAATLVQDGKLFYEMARYDQAEAKLRQAIKIDPANRGASYYMVLVQEAKNSIQVKKRDMTSRESIKDVTKDWVAPGMNFDLGDPEARDGLQLPNALANIAPTNSFPDRIYTGAGRIRIHRLLHNIRLEKFPVTGIVDSLSLQDIVKDLHDTISQIDEEGVNLIIDPLAPANFNDQFFASGLQAFIFQGAAWVDEPTYHFELWWEEGSYGNRVGYKNPAVDELLTTAKTSTDPDVRQAAFDEVQDIMLAEAAAVWIGQPDLVIATSPRIDGYIFRPDQITRFWPITIDG